MLCDYVTDELGWLLVMFEMEASLSGDESLMSLERKPPLGERIVNLHRC